MELKVTEYQLPQALEFNYEELKVTLTDKLHTYETMVYGEDQIKQAKSDRADLNRLKKALNDERLRREKEYMVPFNEFKAKINELIGIIDKAAENSDKQVKAYEQKKKDEKKQQIKEMFDQLGLPEYVSFEKVFDARWLNTSTSPSQIKEGLKDIKYRHDRDIAALDALTEYSFEAKEYYKETLDISGALMQASKLADIAKAKKAAEEQKAAEAVKEAEQEAFTTPESFDKYTEEFKGMPEPQTEPAEWIAFEALLTTKQALALKEFFDSNFISFRPIA